METAAKTGNSHIDLVLECGPRIFNPDLPVEVREEIARSPSLHWFKVELARCEIAKREQALAEIRQIGRENRLIEYKATNGLGVPYCRIPRFAIERGRTIYGFDWWKDEQLLEGFLEAYPECRIKVTRGTRGQEYAGKGRR